MPAVTSETSETATVFGRPVLRSAATGPVPLWRLVLRGCSQCCFQTNEVTGVLFLVAVLSYSWEQSLLMLMGALLGTGTALLVRAQRDLIDLGLFGFNACLMTLALGNFFDKGTWLWVWAAVLAVVSTALTHALVLLLPVPVLAAPFIVTFWIFWPVAEHVGLDKLAFPPFVDEDVFFLRAGFSALGATLFAGTVIAGVLFLLGLLVANWRHAALALVAAFMAHAIALWWSVPGEQINSGLAGFNAVLAAVAIYAFCGEDIRLSIFGAIFASAVLPLFSRLDLVSLAAGFVATTWLVMFLGWFQGRWFNASSPDGTGGSHPPSPR